MRHENISLVYEKTKGKEMKKIVMFAIFPVILSFLSVAVAEEEEKKEEQAKNEFSEI